MSTVAVNNIEPQSGDSVAIAGRIRVPNGTAALPSLGPTANPGDGISFPEAGVTSLSAGGLERARLTSTGNLLLGTAVDRGAKLSVSGGLNELSTFFQGTTDAFHQYRGTPDDVGYHHARVYSGRDATTFAYGSYLAFFTEAKNTGVTDTSVERARLTPTGNLLVGIQTDFGHRAVVSVPGTSNNLALNSSTNATPGKGAGLDFRLTGNTGSSAVKGFMRCELESDGSDVGLNSYLTIGVGNSGVANPATTRVRIDSNGYSRFDPDGQFLDQNGGSDITQNRHTFHSNGVNNIVARARALNTTSYSSGLQSGATGSHFSGVTNATEVYNVAANGNVTNTNNSYGAISDINVKIPKSIVDATPKLGKINAYRIVNYELKTQPGVKLLGMIAQEVEQISPGLIEETPDFHDVQKTRIITKTVPVTQKVLREQSKTEIKLVEGQWREVSTVETVEVDEQVVDEFPLFDGLGQPLMVLVTPEQRDEEGNVVAEAVYKQRTHSLPRTETVEVEETYTKREPTGTSTKSIKYSVLVPMLVKAVQELTARVAALEAA